MFIRFIGQLVAHLWWWTRNNQAHNEATSHPWL